MAGKLTTHVLDTMNGRPAVGLAVTLDRIDGDNRERLRAERTNDDGRIAPMLDGDDFATGVYELTFDIGGYFGSAAFLGMVPVRFTVSDGDAHYHVPLLASPFAYSTYRGS